jgi:hypothetical protein
LQNEVQAGTIGINVHLPVPMAYYSTGRPNDGSPWVADGSNGQPGRPFSTPRLVFCQPLLFGMAQASSLQPRRAGTFPSRTCVKSEFPRRVDQQTRTLARTRLPSHTLAGKGFSATESWLPQRM